MWALDHAVLPYAEFRGENVTIRNIRHLKYASEFEYEPAYYEETFDLAGLKSVDLVLTHFSRQRGPAHVFLSFGFENGKYVAISIEARKRECKKYSPFKGLFWQFELIYVIADERDVIQLRTHHRKNPVYVYPLKISPEKVRIIFNSMLDRANDLRTKPEFYNTLWNSCSTNLVEHINQAFPGALPVHNLKTIFPGYLDNLLQKVGLIDSEPLATMKPRFQINKKSTKYSGEATEFSQKIREF